MLRLSYVSVIVFVCDGDVIDNNRSNIIVFLEPYK